MNKLIIERNKMMKNKNKRVFAYRCIDDRYIYINHFLLDDHLSFSKKGRIINCTQ